MHILEREIILDTDPDTLWEFLSTPMNLNELTPPELHFRVLSEVPQEMYNGLMILYEIQIPLFGKRRWLTEIKHIEAGTFFVDEQRSGPYRLWHHQHHFKEVPGGVEMTDEVNYAIPMGFLGRLAHFIFVGREVNRIFEHRFKVLEAYFKVEKK